MDRWEKLLASTLRVKVLVPTILVMAALLAITVVTVNQVFRIQFRSDAHERLREASVGFRTTEIWQQQEFEQRFSRLSRVKRYHDLFRRVSHEPDPHSVRDQLKRMYEDEGLAQDGVNVVFYTDAGANPTNFTAMWQHGTNSSAAPVEFCASSAAATEKALNGRTGLDTIRVRDEIFRVISIPIFYSDETTNHHVIGALTFCRMLDEEAAKLSFMLAGLGKKGCIAFFAGDRVIRASVFDNKETDASLLARFQRLSHNTNPNADLEDVVLSGKHFYCTSGNFVSLNKDTSLGYLLFYKYQEQLDTLEATQNQVVLVSLLAMLCGALLIMYFVWRALRPLQELRQGAEAVGRGDFTHRIHVPGKDECGQLAMVFNRMTADVEQTQSQLKQTVQTLQSTQAQLIQSEKLSAVGEFVAGVAHELNNPLATVMGFSEILKTAPVDPKYQRHLMMIFKSAERCQKIVQSLLTFARRHQPERVPVAINKLIEEVLEIVAYQLRTNNVEVLREFDLELPMVLADGHQIQQVLINLVNNARQAIEAHQPSGKIIIVTEADKSHVRIKITDDGPGISDENMRKIFDPFFTTKGVGKGTGLGLSLCYGLIKEHGGNITVTSLPGHGATFTVELPVTTQSAPAAAVVVPEPSFQTTTITKVGNGKTVLVIDDEEMLLSLADAELTDSGYTVITANSGEAGLRELGTRKVDAIVCDLKMPGLNGRQVLERVRAEKPALARHFAFVTGDVINDSLAEYFEKEKVEFLNKPFSLADLRGLVKTITRETRTG